MLIEKVKAIFLSTYKTPPIMKKMLSDRIFSVRSQLSAPRIPKCWAEKYIEKMIGVAWF